MYIVKTTNLQLKLKYKLSFSLVSQRLAMISQTSVGQLKRITRSQSGQNKLGHYHHYLFPTTVVLPRNSYLVKRSRFKKKIRENFVGKKLLINLGEKILKKII